MMFDSDNKFLVSTNVNGEISLWNLESNRSIYNLNGLRSVSISPDGNFISSNHDQAIKVWERKTGQEIYSLGENYSYIQALVFSPDSKILVSADADKSNIILWDLTSGKKMATLISPQVFSVVFSSDSRMIASANFDNTIRIWKTQK